MALAGWDHPLVQHEAPERRERYPPRSARSFEQAKIGLIAKRHRDALVARGLQRCRIRELSATDVRLEDQPVREREEGEEVGREPIEARYQRLPPQLRHLPPQERGKYAVDRESLLIDGAHAVVWREDNVLAGYAVLEARQPVGPRM